MNLKQMIARVMRAAPPLPPGKIGEFEIIDMLNQGQEDISERSMQVLYHTETIDPEDFDSLPYIEKPADMLKLHAVYWKGVNGKRELMPAQNQHPTGIGFMAEPVSYYVIRDRIYIEPDPGYEGDVVLGYIPQPDKLAADTDVVEIVGCEQYLIAYALHRIHLELNSPLVQTWEAEKWKAENAWKNTHDQAFDVPMQGRLNW